MVTSRRMRPAARRRSSRRQIPIAGSAPAITLVITNLRTRSACSCSSSSRRPIRAPPSTCSRRADAPRACLGRDAVRPGLARRPRAARRGSRSRQDAGQLPTVPVLYLTPFDQTALNTGNGAAARPSNIEDLQIAQGVDVNGDGIISSVGAERVGVQHHGNRPADGHDRGFFSAGVHTRGRFRVIADRPRGIAADLRPQHVQSAGGGGSRARGLRTPFRRRVLTSTVEKLRNIAGSP